MRFCTKAICRFQHHRLRFRTHAPHHHRHPLFDNSRLLPSDASDVVSQELLVIHPHIRDDGQQRIWKNIGAIQPSTHARF